MRLFRKVRLRWLLPAACIAVLAVVIPVLALSGSGFESTDGNLVKNSTYDWEQAPAQLNLATGVDASQSTSDDSFKGGAKHDDACAPAETGSIPPNKDDLTRLYVAHETIGTDIYLYLGWERFLSKESAASAHMGFEFNQSTTPCPPETGSKGVLRTAGDLLILYDLEGGGKPILTLMRWLTTLGSTDSCEAGGAAPCWGNSVTLGDNVADGAINTTAPILDPISGQTLPFKHQFGEAAINLTDAGVFPPGACIAFGRATLASRSSGNSFTSTLKDFIGPIPIDIENCGDIVIKKETDPDGAAGVFDFTGDQGSIPVPNFTLEDNGVKALNDLRAGSYKIIEGVEPGFDLTSISCVGQNGSKVTTSLVDRSVVIDLVASETVTCTFNNRQRGKLIVEKQTTPDGSSQAFPFSGELGNISLSDGEQASKGDLIPGSYTVTEELDTLNDTLALDWVLTAISCDNSRSSGSGKTATFNIAAGETVKCTFFNRQNGKINVHKQDDAGNSLNGVVFELYKDNAPIGGSRGAEDTLAASCTTNSAGDCSLNNLTPGSYWLVEPNPPAGHTGIAERQVTVGAGQTVSLNLENPRLHRVIVLACHEGTNDLLEIEVVNGTSTKKTISAVPAGLAAKGVTQAELCDLGGASFGGLPHGDKPLTAKIQHP